MFIISIKILKENSHKILSTSNIRCNKNERVYVDEYWNPASTTKPHPQGKSPIRCITTVLLIGWDLSVIKGLYDACAICCEALCVFFYCGTNMWLYSHLFTGVMYESWIFCTKSNMQTKIKQTIPWENQSMGNSNNCSSWDSFSFYALSVFVLLSFIFRASFSQTVLDLFVFWTSPLFHALIVFAIRRRPVVRLRRPDLKAGGWWTLRKKVSVSPIFLFLHLFCHFFFFH